MFGIEQGHAPCKEFHCKDPHDSELLLTPASPTVEVAGTYVFKKEYTTPNPGACKHIMQYDWRPDWHIGGAGLVMEYG